MGRRRSTSAGTFGSHARPRSVRSLCILAMELRPRDGAGGRSQRNRVEIKKDLPPVASKVTVFNFSMLIPRTYPDTPECRHLQGHGAFGHHDR